MLRYITFSNYFIDFKRDGYLSVPGAEGKAAGHLAFEKDWPGDAYFKAVYIAKNAMPGLSLSPNDLIALIFDEHDLLIKGYQIDDSSDLGDKSGILSMVSRGELTTEEYDQIGDIVYIHDHIPLAYMKNVDIPDMERLSRLGLV